MPTLSPTLDEMRDAVGAHFETQWGALNLDPEMPIFWANIADDPSTQAPRDAGFVEMTFAPADPVQVSTGGSTSGVRYRQFGKVFFNIFTPKGEGESTALARAAAIQAMFLGERIAVSGSPTGVRFGRLDAPVSPMVHGASDAWWQVTVDAGFFCDFFKT